MTANPTEFCCNSLCVTNLALSALYFAAFAAKLGFMTKAAYHDPRIHVTEAELETIRQQELPVYTIQGTVSLSPIYFGNYAMLVLSLILTKIILSKLKRRRAKMIKTRQHLRDTLKHLSTWPPPSVSKYMRTLLFLFLLH